MPEVALRPATAADAPLLRRWEREPHIIAALGSDGDWNCWTAHRRPRPAHEQSAAADQAASASTPSSKVSTGSHAASAPGRQ